MMCLCEYDMYVVVHEIQYRQNEIRQDKYKHHI